MPEHHIFGPRSVLTHSTANPLDVTIQRYGETVEESIIFNSWEDLEPRLVEEGIVLPSGPRGTFVDPDILKRLQICLKAAGTPEHWKSLQRHPLVNGKSLAPTAGNPPDDYFYENGERLYEMGDYISWIGLTVDGPEHKLNHKVKLFKDGTIKGRINCFRNGWKDMSGTYLTDYIMAWLERIKIKPKPYWDEIDRKPVSK